MMALKIYKRAYIRAQAARLRPAVNRCYAAARFDGKKHLYVVWKLKISAQGTFVTAKLAGAQPVGKGLHACMIRAFRSLSWAPPNNGTGGWFRMGYSSRIRDSKVR